MFFSGKSTGPALLLLSALAFGCSASGKEPPAAPEDDAVDAFDDVEGAPRSPASSEACDGQFVTVLDVHGDTSAAELAALTVRDHQGTWVAGRLSAEGALEDVELAPAGGDDVLVARLDDCGDVVWARTYGGTGDERALDVVADADGNAYVLGTFEGTSDFGAGPVVGRGSLKDAFVMKVDPAGEIAWWRHVRGDEYGTAVDIDIDERGDLLLLGHVWGGMSVAGERIESEDLTGFVAKLSAGGDVVWISVLGTSIDEKPIEVVAAPSGGAFIAGEDTRGIGLFALGLGAGGEVRWTRSFEADGQMAERFFDMTVDAAGHALLVGRGFGGVDVDPEATIPHLVLELDENGERVWVERSDRAVSGVAARPDGWTTAASFCDTAAACGVEVMTLDEDGAPKSSTTVHGEATVVSLAADSSGRRHLAGALDGSLQLGGSAASGDFYVARVE